MSPKCIHFILLIVIYATLAQNEKYICTLNHTVEVEADKVVFFETPDFPRSLTAKERSECYMNFTKSLVSGEINKTLVFVFSHAICDYTVYCPKKIETLINVHSKFFSLNDSTYAAIQGYVHFDDWTDACPLESVSRIDPFHFSDVSQILRWQSTYDHDKARRHPCLWQFLAPLGYGFKMVITSLDIDSSTIFKIQNSHDVIIRQDNQTKIRLTYPYYTTDNYLQISLSENKNLYLPKSEFIGYLSIVNNNFNQVLINCTATTNGSHILWSYANKFGYPNHARCSYNLTISPNTEVIIGGKKNWLEPGVDIISFYDFSNGMELIHEQPNDMDIKNKIVLTPGDYNTERTIFCEFKSDGSVVSQGFVMDFEILNCTCANPNIVVSCSEYTSVNLMNQNHTYYCGNLHCNYTFKLKDSCTKKFIQIYFNFACNELLSDRKEFDIFKIFSNNKLLFSMNYKDWGTEYSVIVPSGNLNVFQAITAPSLNPKCLTLDFHAFEISTILPTITLNSTKPYFFHDSYFEEIYLDMPSIMQIELSTELKMKNATIDFFLFHRISWLEWNGFLQFYTDTSLTNPLNVENCFVESSFLTNKCKLNHHSFVLIQIGTPTDFFVQATIDDIPFNSEGCIFKHNNIAYLRQKSAMSNDKNSCKIFFFNDDERERIKNIFTNPNANSTIHIFVGITEKLLASIDTETASFWHDIYAKYYYIKIPINTTIMVTSYSVDESLNAILNLTTFPYISVVTSLHFADNYIEDYDGSNLIAKYGVYNYDIKFTLLEMDIAGGNFFYFIHNDTNFNITSDFFSITFPSGYIELWDSCTSNVHCTIRLMLETVDNTPTNPPLQITTLKPTIRSTPPLLITTEQSISSCICSNLYLVLFIQILKIFTQIF